MLTQKVIDRKVSKLVDLPTLSISTPVKRKWYPILFHIILPEHSRKKMVHDTCHKSGSFLNIFVKCLWTKNHMCAHSRISSGTTVDQLEELYKISWKIPINSHYTCKYPIYLYCNFSRKKIVFGLCQVILQIFIMATIIFLINFFL